MQIEWTDPALDDLEAIRDYIGNDSPHYARQFVERVFAVVEKLQDHPHIGRPVSEADHGDVRELIFQGYRIIYRTKPDRVQIATVIHGSRKLAAKETEPWDIV
jgi:addiction module RelE/StbE family toxin